jgi:hypothetical protein
MLFAALAFAAATAAPIETPPPLGACGPIARRHEHVEVRTQDLKKLGKTPIARLGVLALRDGKLAPIPFQVDEREGRRIMMPGGDEPSADSTPGVLDADDGLVFLPCDAGEHASPAALAAAVPELATWREVALTDPLDGRRAWAYVVVAPTPPATARRYVVYEPAADMVATAAYRVGMVQALPNYFATALGHPLGPNLLDGLRLRADGTLKGGLGTLTLTEQGTRNALLAWKDGPVRVLRRSKHDVKLPGLPVHLSAGLATTAFYPLHVYGPGSMKLPISPSVFFRRITAMGGVDLRDLRGWRFVAPGTPPDGFAIDGTMDDVERAFAADGTWFMLVRGEEAVLATVTLSENLARTIPLGIVYLDDAGRDAPPERERGSVPLVGFRGRDVERLQPDRYHFDLRVFLLPSYRPGDAERVLREQQTPLAIAISGPG